MNKESPVRPDIYINGGFVIGSKKTDPCFENAISGETLTIAVSDRVSVKDMLAVVADFSLGITTIVSLLTSTTFTYCVITGSAGR
jgi:hypothetical protein